ncbi:putative adipose-regulatory protein (Seipin) family protein [Acanthocheilonema viteae]
MQKVISWIHDRFSLYDVIIAILQFFGAFAVAVASPFLLRQLLLPSLVKYSVPLHFNFETCREQLAGICSFPTATVNFSVENPKLSPSEYYEMSIEIVQSQSTVTSNVGIFQAVVELVDRLNMKRIFRRSCFANRGHGVLYRIGQSWWNLACQTLFFPVYFFGLLTVLDDRKLEISFTNRFVDSDLANTALIYVQLQNRFLEVESGELSFRVCFGSLRIFLHDYPVISSVLVMILTYFMCLTGIILYWTLQALFRCSDLSNLNCTIPTDEKRSSPYWKSTPKQQQLSLERTEIEGNATFLIWNDLKRNSDKASESSPHQRQQTKRTKQ